MSTIWPAGCNVVFEQHFDPRGEHTGQVTQTMPEARYYTMDYPLLTIYGDEHKILATVNVAKLLILLPILTVGPGAA